MATVLVVDDLAVFREPIAAALRHRGIHTLCAEDGLDALRKLEQEKPDLILLDISMPRMDGMAFLRAMRKDRRFSQIAVILLTAISDRERIIEAGKLGVRDYMLKSRFSLDEMFARIGRYIDSDKPNAATASAATAGATDDSAPAAAAPPQPPRTMPRRSSIPTPPPPTPSSRSNPC